MSSNINNNNNSNSGNLLSLDHWQQPSPPSSEHLCYVHCTLCNTVLAVSVPSSSLLKTVTVRCGHCSNLLPVNMRALLHPPPPPPSRHHFPSNPTPPQNLLPQGGSSSLQASDFSLAQPSGGANYMSSSSASSSRGRTHELPKPPTSNNQRVVPETAPEKRQRMPSAYNRFIKEEIQRIKAGNPDISHREAFSAAAKNWAHFPHIHFGLMPDQTLKRTPYMRPQEAGEDVRMKDGLFGASANLGVFPY